MPMPTRWESYSPAIKNLVEFYGRKRELGEEVERREIPCKEEKDAYRVRALLGGFLKAVDKAQLPNLSEEERNDPARWPELYRYKAAGPRFRAFYALKVKGAVLVLEPRSVNDYEAAIEAVLLPEQAQYAAGMRGLREVETPIESVRATPPSYIRPPERIIRQDGASSPGEGADGPPVNVKPQTP